MLVMIINFLDDLQPVARSFNCWCAAVASGLSRRMPVSTSAGTPRRAGTSAIVVAQPGGATVIPRLPNCGRGTFRWFCMRSVSV